MNGPVASIVNAEEAVYRVVSCEMVTPAIAELRLEPQGERLDYLPGQFFLLGDTAFRIPQRSYSAASAPGPDGSISLLVTRVDGGVTSSWAARRRQDDEVLLQGPFGTFTTAADHTAPMLLLGAGSGLAPLRAITESVLACGSDREITLVHSVRSIEHAIDRRRFEVLEHSVGNFRYVPTFTRDVRAHWHKRVPVLLPRLVETLAGWEIFAAGPGGFVAGCVAAARDLGAADIHAEEFFVEA